MQTPGRTQAAIEILIDIEKEDRPADRVISYYFKNRRYIGSKDKKFIAEVVYGVLRQKGFLNWVLQSMGIPIKPRAQAALWLLHFGGEKDLRPIFSGEEYGPQKLWRTEKPILQAPQFIKNNIDEMPLAARWNCAPWLVSLLERAFGKEAEKAVPALNTQAPADIRVNTLKADVSLVEAALKTEKYSTKKVPYILNGLRLEDPKNLFSLKIFKEGWFEVQDTGSQLLAVLCAAKPGQKVTDFCAGAGGKSLALAAQMANKGTLSVGDVVPQKLVELKKRLRRAGVSNAHMFNWQEEGKKWLKRHQGSQDLVLLDVPCSGSGVWRRNPDAKWRLTPERLKELQAMQSAILEDAHTLVRKGGRLVYATCSVFTEENQAQIHAFLERQKGFKLIPVTEVWADLVAQNICQGFCPPTEGGMLTLAPHRSGTDGFFAAILERTK